MATQTLTVGGTVVIGDTVSVTVDDIAFSFDATDTSATTTAAGLVTAIQATQATQRELHGSQQLRCFNIHNKSFHFSCTFSCLR